MEIGETEERRLRELAALLAEEFENWLDPKVRMLLLFVGARRLVAAAASSVTCCYLHRHHRLCNCHGWR